MRFLSGLFFLFLSALFSGCVSIPVERVSEEIEAAELSGHVAFLAQRGLKGRKAGSWESNTVRKYLVDRFSVYGLLPWGDCKGFEQKFGLGTNVVGLLPGSELSDEIVILSAHYDHIGRTKDGLCLGAGDNASGVAAVLEIAERLSQSAEPLKRTVCFALFDTEEVGMVGSMLFSLRDDFSDANVVAAVTVDMLGRELFDVVDGSLCMVGAERYPALRQTTAKTAAKNGVKLLPLGSEFVGPRGDHVSFSDTVDLSLFFTCGLFPDYHKPSDTPDKLDYKKMAGSTETIYETVVALAGADKIETSQNAAGGYYDELVSLNYIFDKLYLNYEEAGLSKEDNKKLLAIAEKIRKTSTDRVYARAERRKFVRDVLEGILPVIAISDEGLKENGKWMLMLNEIFLIYTDDLIAEYKKIIKEVSQNRLSVMLFGREFWFKKYRFDDEDISLIIGEDGVYDLDLVFVRFNLNFNIGGLFSRKRPFHPFIDVWLYGCTGTKDEIIDYCLVKWGAPKPDQAKVYNENWQKVIARIDGRQVSESYEERLDRRFKQGGFKGKEQWMLAMLESGNDELLKEVISNAPVRDTQKVNDKIAEIITNKELRADIRRNAIMASSDKVSLAAVVDVLDDETVYKPDRRLRSMRESFPLKDHPFLMMEDKEEKKSEAEDKDKKKTAKNEEEIARLKEKHKQEIIKQFKKKNKGLKAEHIMFDEEAAIGAIAGKHLRVITRKDFKKDKDAWKKWISENEIKCRCREKKKIKV